MTNPVVYHRIIVCVSSKCNIFSSDVCFQLHTIAFLLYERQIIKDKAQKVNSCYLVPDFE